MQDEETKPSDADIAAGDPPGSGGGGLTGDQPGSGGGGLVQDKPAIDPSTVEGDPPGSGGGGPINP